ncbi:NB-ARC domains-containing protein [Tanacetum coccineum]
MGQGNDFRLRKLKMPLFDGNDVFRWVYRAEIFFDVQKVNASEERLTAAPSQEGSLYEQFLNISQQEGSTREYMALFEKMAAQFVGIQEEILEGTFIKGLKPELKTAVRTQQPKGVTKAIQLTLLIDETRSGGEWGKSSNSRLGSRTGGEVPRPTASHVGDPNSKLVAGAAGEPPFKRMSEAEFADKKAKGLCFRCDGKFTPGHKCPVKSLQVMVIYDGETNDEEEHEPAQLEGCRLGLRPTDLSLNPSDLQHVNGTTQDTLRMYKQVRTEVDKWKEALSTAADLSGWDLQDMTNGFESKSHKVDEIYEMETLEDCKALELFSLYAFGKRHPTEDFDETASQIVKYLQGHPLALKVFGQTIVNDKSASHFLEKQNHKRLWISSEDYDVLNVNKVTEEVEVLVLLLNKNGQNIPIDGQALTRMKNLRILKICCPKVEGRWQPFAFSGRLDSLSNKLRLLYWHGLPLKFLPSNFYPENIVTIDLSYSHIKHLWTTPKCFMRLKIMKLSYCCYLTSTPDFSEITNLEELTFEGCENLVKLHPSIGTLKKLVVLNMRDCKLLKSFPSKLKMVSLQILILSGCLKIEKLPEDLGRIKSLTELYIDRTSITELPLFGQEESIQSRWWTSITAPFGLLSKQQHPQRSLSLAGFHMLKSLNFSYCSLLQVPQSIEGLSCLKELNLEGNHLLEVPESIGGLSCLKELNLDGNNLLHVPESIGGLSCLERLDLKGNNFTSLPGSLSQLSDLKRLDLGHCEKLEVLPEIPHSLNLLYASHCTSLCSLAGLNPTMIHRSTYLSNCPKLFKILAIDTQVSSETQCLDSSITSQGSTNQFSSFLQYAGIQNNRCEFFRFTGSLVEKMDIMYHGNSIPEWFTNKSMGNHVKVELPSDWCFKKFRGYGTCLVFKRKKLGYRFIRSSVKNFDGAYLDSCFLHYHREYFNGKPIRINESYMIWLLYTKSSMLSKSWKEAKNFVTFCFEVNEEIEVKECGVRLVCDEDLEQDTNLSMFGDLLSLSQHGGALYFSGPFVGTNWSWSSNKKP